MKNKFLKISKGITLIGLVVTIIVLLILLGVTLNLVTENKSTIEITKWSEFVDEYKKVDDAKALYIAGQIINNYGNSKKINQIYKIASKEIVAPDSLNTYYPVDINQKVTYDDLNANVSLKYSIMNLENLVNENDLKDDSNVSLYKVDFSKLKMTAKREYIINIVTGKLYSIPYQKYKGLYYHTPDIGVTENGKVPEIEQTEGIVIHYLPGYSGADSETQIVDYDTTSVNLRDISSFSFNNPPGMFKNWKDVTSEYITDIEEIDDGNGETEEKTYDEGAEIVLNGSDVYLEAQWSSNIVKLHGNGGSVLGEEEIDFPVIDGQPYGKFPELDNVGYIFGGWYNNNSDFLSENEVVETDIYTVSSGITDLYAYWVNSAPNSENVATITYNVNSSAGETCETTSKQVLVGKKLGTSPIPKKEGYVFDTWTLNDKVTTVNANTVVNSDMNLYARFKIHITFDYQGGTVDTRYRKTPLAYKNVKIGTKLGNIGAYAIKPGYKGNGWWSEPKGQGKKYTANTIITETEDFTVYADWLEPYTIRYDLNYETSSSSPASKTVYRNSKYGTLPKVKRDGYIFDGWYTETTSGQKVTENDIVNGDITIYAHWILKQGLVYDPSDDTYLVQDAVDLKYIATQTNASTTTKILAITSDGRTWSEANPEDTTSRNYVAYTAKYKVTDNIDLSSVCSSSIGTWTPIGKDSKNYFGGTFDGCGYTISNFYLDGKSNFQGFFGYLNSATIKNVNLEGIVQSTGGGIGGLIGRMGGGLTDNCTFRGTVTASGTIDQNGAYGCYGGIVGFIGTTGGTISNCINYAVITSTGGRTIGGIVGEAIAGNVINCKNYGQVNGNSLDAAGIVGMLGREYYSKSATVSQCINYEDITSNGNHVAGIAGQLSHAGCVVRECVNTGDISGPKMIGGIVGCTDENGGKSILYCYNLGEVTGTSAQVGGIIGYSQNSSDKIQYCYNINQVTGTTNVGGIVGQLKGKVTNCLWLTGKVTATGTSATINSQGTEVEYEDSIKDIINQDEWKDYFVEDTENINNGLPVLSWQNSPKTGNE